MPVSTPPSRSPPPQTLAAPRPRVLVVDDELSMAETRADGLIERGYDAVPVGSSRQAAKMLEDRSFVALVTDLRMPELDGLELLATSRRLAPERPVIVMTAYSALDTAIESIRRGAYHYATKPFKLDEIALFLGRALDEVGLRRETTSLKPRPPGALRPREPGRRARRCARSPTSSSGSRTPPSPFFFSGKPGTERGSSRGRFMRRGPGRARRSSRSTAPRFRRPCSKVSCSGTRKAPLPGATNARAGLFAEADRGTLFLDEIGEMSAALQAKLLHVLESGVVRGVGEAKERAIDVRFLTATHRDLRARVASGEFREDLMYRLEVVTIELPPLRHRKDDLPALIQHFLARARDRHRASIVERFSPEALDQLLAHPWPGNVRELEHVVERVVLLGRTSEVTLADLPSQLRAKQAEASPVFGEPVLPMREMQRRYAAWAYEHFGGRKLLTAERLGIDDKTLTSWLGKREPREPRE